jgi:hypothetical protein
MALKFNKDALIKEFLNNLELELDVACTAWKEEALSKMRGIYFSHESEKMEAEVEKEILKKSKGITVYLKANAVALADSYGVGSLMTTDNPGLQDYMNSDRWNPRRTGTAIVGRDEGDYTDLFGRKKHTSGAFGGKNLENRGDVTETDYHISPSKPSYALQMAEQWLYKTYLPRAYKNAVNATNFAKFLIES